MLRRNCGHSWRRLTRRWLVGWGSRSEPLPTHPGLCHPVGVLAAPNAEVTVAQLPTRPGHFSYADYLGWHDGQRWELIDGEAVCMSPAPSLAHQVIVTELTRQVGNALLGKRCLPITAPIDVRLATADQSDDQIDRVVQPDLLVVCDPAKLDRRGVLGAPDLVVEVVSPATASHDHVKKRRLCEVCGVREFWLVHPTDRIVAIYTLTNGEYGRPELLPMQGQTALHVLPEVVVDWEAVVERLGPVED
ncbi:MAG: Uma2 family endonuclease [Deltaproteobacteria bacterium]|nr:Uma2 family endonuclease [Deltaproteobacteria bacterium]